MTGLDPDDLLPIRPALPRSGTEFWLAMRRRLVVRPSSSKFRQTRHGRVERFYEMGGSGYRSGVEARQPGSGVVV